MKKTSQDSPKGAVEFLKQKTFKFIDVMNKRCIIKDNNGNIIQLNDLSGNVYHLSPAAPKKRPFWKKWLKIKGDDETDVLLEYGYKRLEHPQIPVSTLRIRFKYFIRDNWPKILMMVTPILLFLYEFKIYFLNLPQVK